MENINTNSDQKSSKGNLNKRMSNYIQPYILFVHKENILL